MSRQPTARERMLNRDYSPDEKMTIEWRQITALEHIALYLCEINYKLGRIATKLETDN